MKSKPFNRKSRQRGITYRVDDFLAIEDPDKAYCALRAAIYADRRFSAEELRVISLDEFLEMGWSQGVSGMYWQRRWAIVPCAELMDAIDEPYFAEIFWRGIAITREYGQKVGRDPFKPNSDYVDLDEEAEGKLKVPEMEFFKHELDVDLLCRKTMDYVRKNRELFTEPNQP